MKKYITLDKELWWFDYDADMRESVVKRLVRATDVEEAAFLLTGGELFNAYPFGVDGLNIRPSDRYAWKFNEDGSEARRDVP